MRRLVVMLALVLTGAISARGQVSLPDEPFEYDADEPTAGLWAGNVLLNSGLGPEWAYAVLRVARRADGGGVRCTMIARTLVALGIEAGDVEIDDGRIAFEVTGQVGGGRLEAEVADDGQRLRGTFALRRQGGDPLEGKVELGRHVEVLDLPGHMAFSGEIDVQSLKLGMTIAFAKTPGGAWVGHVDVPAQQTAGFVLANVISRERSLSAVMPGPVPAYLEVVRDADDRRLTGTMKQGPFELAIDFSRDEGYVGSALRRPQHPKPPYPYAVREVTIEHPDGHTLAGTLTVPEAAKHGDGPFPAAVLVTGSGPQDRDESLMGHKPFLVIADHLTRHGIAVLRYDDRGVGRSTGALDRATTVDFATDTVAVVEFLRGQPGIDTRRVGVVGHSEGGLVAPLVAARTDLAFAVLLAGPGVPGDALLGVQLEKISRAEGIDAETTARQLATQQAFFATLRTNPTEDELRAAVGDMIAEATDLQGDALDQAVTARLERAASPWMRWFVTHDPRPDLAAMKCPVLALNGTLDLQVWHEQNLDEIERVIRDAGGDVTAKRYEGLNHLFQPAKTGRVGEYAEIEITFDEQVLRDIVAWIHEKVES